MRKSPMSRNEMVEAVAKSYPGKKTDLREMGIKRLRKLYKVVSLDNLIKLMRVK